MSARAQKLAEDGETFVTATVVRAQPPTSVVAGDVALVLADGTVEGFVGGVCTEHSVRAYSLQTMATGQSVLLRILPFNEAPGPGDGRPDVEGAVTVQNPCLSGGAIEVFLEPVLPAPRVLVVGSTPIAGAIPRLGAELGLNIIVYDGEQLEVRPDDLALVVAAHGRDELHTLRLGLEAGIPYVGLVASPKRGTGVLAELRADGVPEEQLARIDVPAGLDIGARSPAEIALSILANIISARHEHPVDLQHDPLPEAPATEVPIAVDPICHMTVAAVPGTPSVERDGETIYFCCEGCKSTFEAQSVA
jgi:xanthine dehydrogenase accessory factor